MGSSDDKKKLNLELWGRNDKASTVGEVITRLLYGVFLFQR